MKVVRSWPSHVPDNRNYVHDDLPRLIMADYDYRILADLDDDVLLLEWDVAVGQDDLVMFARRAQQNPQRVLVAPYRLYVSSTQHIPLAKPIWTHRVYIGTPETGRMRHVEPTDSHCNLFGFGMTYFPRDLIRRYLADRQPSWGFSDLSFSGWHHRRVEPEVPIAWEVRPVHLHYRFDQTEL